MDNPDSEVYRPFLHYWYPLFALFLAGTGAYFTSLIIELINTSHEISDIPQENKWMIAKIKLKMIALALPAAFSIALSTQFIFVSATTYEYLYPGIFDYGYKIAFCQIFTAIIIILLLLSLIRAFWRGNYAVGGPLVAARQIVEGGGGRAPAEGEREPPVPPPEEGEAPVPPQEEDEAQVPAEIVEEARVPGQEPGVQNLGEALNVGEAPGVENVAEAPADVENLGGGNPVEEDVPQAD